MKRFTQTAILGLVALALVAAPSAAAMKKSFELVAPKLTTMHASGLGVVTQAGKDQTFQVRVFADTKEGAIMTVLVERTGTLGEAQLTPVGKIRMTLGSGLFELDNRIDVSPVFPIKGLQRVVVEYNGKQILEGRVWGLSTGN